MGVSADVRPSLLDDDGAPGAVVRRAEHAAAVGVPNRFPDREPITQQHLARAGAPRT
jgi:hypothetical protein